jgi:hypothetical protein
VSGVLNDRRVGRLVVALAATALMVGGGYLGSTGSAQAGDEPDIHNVGTPGRDGGTVTCYTSPSPNGKAPICNAAANGEDGTPGVVYRR